MGMSALVGIDSVRSAVVHGQYGALRQACYAVGGLFEQAWVGSPNSLTNTTMAVLGFGCRYLQACSTSGLQHHGGLILPSRAFLQLLHIKHP